MLDRRFFDVNIVVQGIANEPAANTTAGTQYIVGPNPTGAFEDVASDTLARYDGSAWTFVPAKEGSLEVLNIETGEILGNDGSDWIVISTFIGSGAIAPVLDIVGTGTELPVTAAQGDKFLNTADGKLYTATAENTWNAGVATAEGDRYVSSNDFKVYENNGSSIEVAGNIPNGGFFLADDCVYVRNDDSLVKADVSEEVTEIHALTATDVQNKSFTLSRAIAAGKEQDVMLSVCGLIQVVGTDYIATGNVISWANKGLDNASLRAGDTFVVRYSK